MVAKRHCHMVFHPVKFSVKAMFQWSVQKIHLPQSLSEEANADELSD